MRKRDVADGRWFKLGCSTLKQNRRMCCLSAGRRQRCGHSLADSVLSAQLFTRRVTRYAPVFTGADAPDPTFGSDYAELKQGQQMIAAAQKAVVGGSRSEMGRSPRRRRVPVRPHGLGSIPQSGDVSHAFENN